MLIKELLGDLQNFVDVTYVNITKDLNITQAELLDETRTGFNDNTLYFSLAGSFRDGAAPPNVLLYTMPDGTETASVNTIVVAQKDFAKAFNSANELLTDADDSTVFDDLVQTAAKTHSLTEVLNAAAQKLDCFLIVIDDYYSVVAYSSSVPVPTEGHWVNTVENGCCSWDLIRYIKAHSYPHTGIEEIFCDKVSFREFRGLIFNNGEMVATVLMLCSSSPVTPRKLDIFSKVCNAVRYTIINYEPYVTQPKSRLKNLMCCLLSGAPKRELDADVKYAGKPKPIQVFTVIDQDSRKIHEFIDSVFPQFAEIYPAAKQCYFNRSLIISVPAPNGESIKENLAQLTELAREKRVKIGISPVVDDLFQLLKGYNQTVTALDLGEIFSPESRVFRYEDYLLYDLFSKYPDRDRLIDFVSPLLIQLDEYDKENHTDFYNTLFVYLRCKRQPIQAAKELFIHRNSLANRLERITEFFHIEWEDTNALINLEFSFLICNYLKTTEGIIKTAK